MTGSAIAGAYLLLFVGQTATPIPMKDMKTCMGQIGAFQEAVKIDHNIKIYMSSDTDIDNLQKESVVEVLRFSHCVETGY